FGPAFIKAMMSAGQKLPEQGTAFISVNNSDKPTVLPIARELEQIGFRLTATRGTAAFLRAHGIAVDVIYKVNEGRPNVADHLVNGSIHMIINTPLGRESFFDDRAVRRAATMDGTAVAWGYNALGQTGSTPVLQVDFMKRIPGTYGVSHVAAGAYHSVAGIIPPGET
ncbi:MAG TPA: hypothetical protein VHI31_06405, partial [Actinomycetota bacterium]|nr:hypothetical protein [Actinomycetota bacterium]